jgi:hypothetical protein
MAVFADVLPTYQQVRIFNRIDNGEDVWKVFADYIKFFGNMPLSLCFQSLLEEYKRAGKNMVLFANDFLNNVDENVSFGVKHEEV